MPSRMTADIAVNAFRMALFRQKREAPEVVHSGRGSQYASDNFRGFHRKGNPTNQHTFVRYYRQSQNRLRCVNRIELFSGQRSATGPSLGATQIQIR